jgi:hypothetical protein
MYGGNESWDISVCMAARLRAGRRVFDSLQGQDFFLFGATAPIWALACLHETLRFTSVF